MWLNNKYKHMYASLHYVFAHMDIELEKHLSYGKYSVPAHGSLVLTMYFIIDILPAMFLCNL